MDDKNSGMKIIIDPAQEDGVYSNGAIIAHSPSEFVFNFLRILPDDKTKLASRVTMTPEHAKRFLIALQENIRNYESTFEPIKIHGGGVAEFPLKNPRGEA